MRERIPLVFCTQSSVLTGPNCRFFSGTDQKVREESHFDRCPSQTACGPCGDFRAEIWRRRRCQNGARRELQEVLVSGRLRGSGTLLHGGGHAAQRHQIGVPRQNIHASRQPRVEIRQLSLRILQRSHTPVS